MADEADKANDSQAEDLERRIKAARTIITHKNGPRRCVKCDDQNDQYAAGLAICSGCMEPSDE